MGNRWRTSWRRSRRGITLVEAVLGTALLGSLLVAILLGAARLQVQAARAERRVTACRIADELLEGWWVKPDDFPRRGSGRVASHEGWSWRTGTRRSDEARALGGEIVSLEVWAPAAAGDAVPAARVELLLPEKQDEDVGRTDTR